MDLNLLCTESISPDSALAMKDKVILDDSRVLDHLLLTEHIYSPTVNYQDYIDSSTRQTVIKWIQEVCEYEQCLGAVFPLAVNYFDRFVCKCKVPKKFLQLVSAVCILIASKIRQNNPVHVNTLCYYADNSFTACQLRNFETLIASKLDWDLSSVTAYDFLDQILHRISWYDKSKKIDNTVRNHSVTLVHLCCSENEFHGLTSSTVATAAVVSALEGLKISVSRNRLEYICSLTKSDPEQVMKTVAKIEKIVTKETSRLLQAANNNGSSPYGTSVLVKVPSCRMEQQQSQQQVHSEFQLLDSDYQEQLLPDMISYMTEPLDSAKTPFFM